MQNDNYNVWETTYASAYNKNRPPQNQPKPRNQATPKSVRLINNNYGELESPNDAQAYYIQRAKAVKQYAYLEFQNPEYHDKMEDKGKSIDCFSGFSQALFCLYDGHNDDKVSTYLQNILHNEFRILLKQTNNNFTKEQINQLFAKIDLKFKEDKEFLESGSTACVVYISDGGIFCFNVGDTRCSVFNIKNKKYERISIDDRVGNKAEEERVLKAGGMIINNRVCGNIMLTRSFGDSYFKEYGLICKPHMNSIIREPGQILVIASDGIWDVLEEKDINEIINQNKSLNLMEINEKILKEACDKNSMDNMSIFTIEL